MKSSSADQVGRVGYVVNGRVAVGRAVGPGAGTNGSALDPIACPHCRPWKMRPSRFFR